MQGLLLMAALLLGSGAALAADGPLTDAVDTPEAVRQQLRDYFFNAARFGDNEVLDEFIRAGYDLNSAEDKRGNTALLGAIFKGELGIAKRLLATECDPNQRNNAGQTPAMYAALFQREALLQALRERGADLNAADPLGNSVESLARGEIRTR
ncbi:MAG TPA: hypothetical protein DC052_07765 [Pseudomonas sp.]|nr:hypothetical protein [Pseudomonas sp.]